MYGYNMPDGCSVRELDCFDDETPREKELQYKLDTIEDFLIDVLAELYSGDEDLNVEHLENCLEEIAHQVGLRIPAKKLMIRRNK